MKLFGPSRLGNIMIVTGLLLLLYIPASYAWTDLQGVILQAQLRGELPPSGPAGLEAAPSPSPLGPQAAGTQAAGPQAATTAATPARSNALGRADTATPQPEAPAAALNSGASTDIRSGSPFAPDTATPAPSPTPLPTATPTATPAPSPTPVPLGPPVRIVFPALRIDTGVTQMGWTAAKPGGAPSEWEVPENTAGWAINSAPLGVPGNIVLAGHNNIYGMVFRSISLAWPQTGKPSSDPAVYTSDILNGRTIELYAANGQRFVYEVTDFHRLQDYGLSLGQIQQNADYMQPTPDPELTLITCWPPWSNTYRLVVRAKLVQ